MTVRVIAAKRYRSDGQPREAQRALLRVAAYCRVSTDSKEQETSYEAQCAHYISCISQNPDWVLSGIYADEGVSGTQAKRRPEFLRMIRDCEAGRIDLIVTKSISRFARNTLDTLTYIRRLKELGIAILFEKEGINTLDAQGEVLITIMASLAQQESQSISQNVRLGIQYQMQEGRGRLNTSRFLGLTRRHPGEPLVIVEEEAPIVRRIFREYLEGMSPALIARRLERDGIDTPSGKKNWYASTIQSMLRNEKYCGDLLMQKYYVTDFLTHKLARNTGELPQYYVEDAHEPIIPREVFDQVQAECARRGTLKREPARIRFGSEAALEGRLVCGLCGRTLKRCRNSRTDEVSWRCLSRAREIRSTHREQGGMCNCRVVSAEAAQTAILCAFNRLGEFRASLTADCARIRTTEIKEIDTMLKTVIESLRTLETKKETIEGSDADGFSTQDRLTEKTARLEQRHRDLMLARAELANKEIHLRLLLELLEEMDAAGVGTGAQHDQDASEADLVQGPCYEYEGFFRLTRRRLAPDMVDGCGRLARFDDETVVRHLDMVVVHEDRFIVRFKAGVEVAV